MPENNINRTTLSDMNTNVSDYSVTPVDTDGVGNQKETTYINENWTTQLGYYKEIPEFNRAIKALVTWTAGKGYVTEPATKVKLEHIRGWGEDTFTDILQNLLTTKKIAGDAFAEIIRDEKTGILINLKPLNPGTIKIVVNQAGIITKYIQVARTKTDKDIEFKPNQIFHICNDRIADEIHGTSIADVVSWVITARKEAMNDWKRISHRSTIRVMYIDADDVTKLTNVKKEYADAIDKGELMLIPAKKGEAEFQDLDLPPIDAFLRWIQYLENFFYQAVGVPRVIATSEGFTESGGKVGFLTFEPIYTNEQVSLEDDLWNQLAIKIKFNRPPSLGGDLKRDEAKDPNAFQPNDTQAGVGQ